MREPHKLTEIIANRVRELAIVPDVVAVIEARRDDHFLLVHIEPGTPENIGALIGKKGARIEALRRYIEALALDINLTVQIRVLAPDRRPLAANP